MNTTLVITLLVLCVYNVMVTAYSGPHSCYTAYTCYRSSNYGCGLFGWGRCYRRYSKDCYRSVCCSGWSADGKGGCTKPICKPPCANGGTCVNPNTCSCTIYYQGSTCWNKKSCSGKQFELLLILDSSGSIGRENFERVKHYAKNIVKNLDIGPTKTRVGLMTFSRYPVIRFHLDAHTNKTSVLDAIEQVPYITGITETYAALTLLQQEGFSGSRSNVPHVAIIVTEGTSRHVPETSRIASTLHSQGVTMFAVGVGPDVTTQELHAIASDPDSRHTFTVADYQSLSSTLTDLTTLTCDVPYHHYSVQTTPSPVLVSHTRQEPLSECEGKVADVMFILDSSIDVGQTHFKSVEHFAMNIINDLDIGEKTTQVGVITFNTYPIIRQALNGDKLHLLNVVNQIPYYSGTRETDRALELLRLEGFDGDRYTAPNIAIIITNGVSHNAFLTKRSADSVKQSGIEVFVVGVGSRVNQAELQDFATSTSHVTEVSNFVEFDLSNFEFEIARNVCDTIQIITTQSTSTTTETTTPTPTTIDLVTLSPWNGSSCFPDVADVIFLLDSSSSMGLVNFEMVKDYIKQTIGLFDVGMNATRIGLILYSTDAKIVFSLDQYNNSQDILDAVDSIKYSSGGTNTGRALELMRTQGFLHDRNVTSNIAFLITDGNSKDKVATRQQARLAKQDDQFVIVVTGIGTHLDFQELTDIASQNSAKNESLIYHVNSFDELQSQSLHDILTRVVCGVGSTTVAASSSSSTFLSPVATSITTMAATSQTTAQTSPASPTLNSSCFDKIDTCIGFGKDVCTDYRPWAMDNCRLYCGFCEGPTTPSGPCEDAIDNCQEYGPYICTTTSFLLWSRDNCPRYCQMCDPGPVPSTTPTVVTTTTVPKCVNTVNNCPQFGSYMCSHPEYQSWAEAHCSEFCGFCSNYVDYQSQTVDNNFCPAWHLPKDCKMVPVDGHCCPLPQCPDGYTLSANHPNQL